ncbi:MAG TPA: response regulator transcription factor [Clostridia bacterium]|nr:response regulator transcription factor [Clostridia bacterium]
MEEKRYTVLVADDEKEITEILRLYLENSGLDVIEVFNGIEALNAIKTDHRKIDLAIVDIMMPEMDGYTLVKKIRETHNIPIIILSARTDDSGKILGLDLGADDYITKPFNPLEVAARVQAHLRRFYRLNSAERLEENRISAGGLTLDKTSCKLNAEDREIVLTAVEYRIMQLLMEHPGRVFTKSQIYEHVWGNGFYESDDNTVMVHISKLREKIEKDPREPVYLKTIRGLGYRFEKRL